MELTENISITFDTIKKYDSEEEAHPCSYTMHFIKEIELVRDGNDLGVYVLGNDPDWKFEETGRVVKNIKKIYLSDGKSYESYTIKNETDLAAVINPLQIKTILNGIK
jgi:hypothetical protein